MYNFEREIVDFYNYKTAIGAHIKSNPQDLYVSMNFHNIFRSSNRSNRFIGLPVTTDFPEKHGKFAL